MNQKFIHHIEAINNIRKDKAKQMQQGIDRHRDRLVQFKDQKQFLEVDLTHSCKQLQDADSHTEVNPMGHVCSRHG
jgi:hypothetical protein